MAFLDSILEITTIEKKVKKGKTDGENIVKPTNNQQHYPFPQQPVNVVPQQFQQVAQTPVVNYQQAGIDTSKFEEHLGELLMEAKKKKGGIDIYEFLQSINNLSSLGLQEVQAYQNAYFTLKTMGLTKEKLTQSCNDNINLIASDQNNFNSEIQKAMDSDLSEKNESIKKLSEEIAEFELVLNNRRMLLAETNTQLQQNQTLFSEKKNGFDIAAKKYIGLYQSSLNKIENYITQ